MKHHLDPSTCGFVIGICMEDSGDLELAERKITDAEVASIFAEGATFAKGCGVEPRVTDSITRDLIDAIGPAQPTKVIEYFTSSLQTVKSNCTGGDTKKSRC
jgi:hypothetical protein